MERSAKYKIIYITPKKQYWGITDTGSKTCLIKNIGDVKMLDNFLSDKKIISYTDSKLYKAKQIPFNFEEAVEGLTQAFAKLEMDRLIKKEEIENKKNEV